MNRKILIMLALFVMTTVNFRVFSQQNYCIFFMFEEGEKFLENESFVFHDTTLNSTPYYYHNMDMLYTKLGILLTNNEMNEIIGCIKEMNFDYETSEKIKEKKSKIITLTITYYSPYSEVLFSERIEGKEAIKIFFEEYSKSNCFLSDYFDDSVIIKYITD